MRPRTVSFAGTDDSFDYEDYYEDLALQPPGLQVSSSQPLLSSNKTSRELTEIDTRLSKLQDRVRQTLAGGTSIPTALHKIRASTSGRVGSVNGTRAKGGGGTRRPRPRPLPAVMSPASRSSRTAPTAANRLITIDSSMGKDYAVKEPIVFRPAVGSGPPIFTDQRLQEYADQYEREAEEFSSVALHAQVRLKQLELMGEVPNTLALAVSLDVLRRLGEVSGRYSDIIQRVHKALLPHCYLDFQPEKEDNDEEKTMKMKMRMRKKEETMDGAGVDPASFSSSSSSSSSLPLGTPTRLVDYLKARPTFLHVERVGLENEGLKKKMETLRQDRFGSISALSNYQKGE